MYTVKQWTPGVAGDVLIETNFVEEVLEAVKKGGNQIRHSDWPQGYVAVCDDGTTNLKYFPNCNSVGFNGDAPAEAVYLAEQINLQALSLA